MQDTGLVPALRNHLAALEDSEGLVVDFQVEEEAELTSDQEEGLFRIVQEALNNVSKHAQTDRATVTLQMRETTSLMIEDQGVGFDYSPHSTAGEGFGLSSMRERVDILGGSFEVRSSPGAGTTILIEIPQTSGGKANG